MSSSTTRIVLCAALCVAADALPASTSEHQEPRVIDVVARRFAFEPAEIEAAVGERLVLSVTSADGVHGVEIKKFKVKKEVPRGGAPVLIEFVAGEPGRFPIVCSEYCGEGHNDMKGMLVVTAIQPQP